jgi:hypothetical protein
MNATDLQSPEAVRADREREVRRLLAHELGRALSPLGAEASLLIEEAAAAARVPSEAIVRLCTDDPLDPAVPLEQAFAAFRAVAPRIARDFEREHLWSVERQLQAFLEAEPPFHGKTHRLADANVDVTVRRGSRALEGHPQVSTLEIVRVATRPTGQGHLTRFLAFALAHCGLQAVVVEDVTSPRLAEWFRRGGWTEFGPDIALPEGERVSGFYRRLHRPAPPSAGAP